MEYIKLNFDMPIMGVSEPQIKLPTVNNGVQNNSGINNDINDSVYIKLPNNRNIIKNIRKKLKIKDIVIKELSIQNMVTFVEMKKVMLSYLKKNGLLFEKSIKVNNFIAQLLGIGIEKI